MPTTLIETEEYTESVVGPATGDARTSASVRTMGSPLANRAKWARARMAEFFGDHLRVEAANPTTDVITITGHGLTTNAPVRFIHVAGSLPGGLSPGVVYYLRDVTSDTFKVAPAIGDAAIDLTSGGSGSIYVFTVPDAANNLYCPASGVLPAGPLRGQLTYLRDNYPLLSGSNEWLSGQTFRDDVIIASTGFLDVGGAASFSGNLSALRASIGNTDTFTITGTEDQTISVATARTFFAATPTANRILTLSLSSPVPFPGEEIEIVRPSTGAFTYSVWKAGGGAAMATLAASTHCSARFHYAGTWRLISWTDGVTVGSEA